MTTSPIQSGEIPTLGAAALNRSKSTWNHDAVRIAEQIKRQVPDRPATIIIGGLENSAHSSTIALEVSQSLAILASEPILLLDADAGESGLAALAKDRFPQAKPPRAIRQILGDSSRPVDLTVKLQDHLLFSFLEPVGNPDDPASSLISPENLAAIQQARAHFPLTVLHSVPFSRQESYALLSKADFILIVVSQGESSFTHLEQLYNQCQTITDAPLAAVLAKV